VAGKVGQAISGALAAATAWGDCRSRRRSSRRTWRRPRGRRATWRVRAGAGRTPGPSASPWP